MIVNGEKLSKNALFEDDRKARETTLAILEAALKAVDPREVIRANVHVTDHTLHVGGLVFDLEAYRRVFVVGGGKASGAMAEALEETVGDAITEGFVNVLRGTKSGFKTRRIFLNEAGHPIPDEAGVFGAKKIMQLVEKPEENDLVICLISGGGSALMPFPAVGITLQDKQRLTDALLKCGATIDEINAVRKHISDLKGGNLARKAYPATLVSLILSDVVGDNLHTIASGPTTPDATTFEDAVSILKKYGLWEGTVPESIKSRLKAGLERNIPETPKPGDKVFDRTHHVIVGNNRLAAATACRKAESLGFNSLLLSTMIEGEARHVGTAYAGIVREIAASNRPVSKPAVVVAGGETTVTVTGQGKGGRNQELVLSASLKIGGLRGVVVASIGTDGIDGPTDAAGAVADGQTTARAWGMGLIPEQFLSNNDSYGFFSKTSDLIFTGPTGTNVTDLAVMVVV